MQRVQAAAKGFEQWCKQDDPEYRREWFGCDLQKTDSLMSPYIATISWFLPPAGGSKKTPTPERGDIQIAYQFAFQNGRWEFVKGTWTAYHYDGTVNVSSKADQKYINSLSELLNK